MVMSDISCALPLSEIRCATITSDAPHPAMAPSTEPDEPMLPWLEPALPKIDAPSESGRVDDLLAQIAYLEQEVLQGRELLEQERLRHATQIANRKLGHDTELDELRREELARTQKVHESYRALLNERQLEFEHGLSTAAAEAAALLEAEQQRHVEMLKQERSRKQQHEDAEYRRSVSELVEQHDRSTQDLRNELLQASSSISRLEAALAKATERAETAESKNGDLAMRLGAAERRLEQVTDVADHRQDAQRAELEQRVELAEQRLTDERRRAAATLAEVLEQSAALAAETDSLRSSLDAAAERNNQRTTEEVEQVRTDFAAHSEAAQRDFDAERSRLEQAAAMAKQESDDAYRKLSIAADEQTAVFLQRESELEALIVELRRRVVSTDNSEGR